MELGNAIRRFETYAVNRYLMDSQLLWHHLQAAAPAPAVNQVDAARTNVDFYVCLIYGFGVVSVASIVISMLGGSAVELALIAIAAVSVIVLGYRLALAATDEWNTAVRAMVDHARIPVAALFGFTVPPSLAEEREMWQAVNTLVRRPYQEARERGSRNCSRSIGQDPTDQGVDAANGRWRPLRGIHAGVPA